jgi:pantothenate kinase type III
MSITSLITQVLEKVMDEHGKASTCIITGGHAEEIQTFLGVEFVHDPYLVLNGIALMAENL